jgi:hypothetical protein
MKLFLIVTEAIVDHIVWDTNGRKGIRTACNKRAFNGRKRHIIFVVRILIVIKTTFSQFLIMTVIIMSSVSACIMTFKTVTQLS